MNGPALLEGVAIAGGDVTRGSSGNRKKWPAEVLRQAADSLQGKNLVVGHDNSPYGVVGEVVDAYFDGSGVHYRAELDDSELAEKVENGRLDVSARMLHRDPEKLAEDDSGALVVDKTAFDNLSLVTKPGAAASNTVGVAAA
jgi:hypothetical protein